AAMARAVMPSQADMAATARAVMANPMARAASASKAAMVRADSASTAAAAHPAMAAMARAASARAAMAKAAMAKHQVDTVASMSMNGTPITATGANSRCADWTRIIAAGGLSGPKNSVTNSNPGAKR